MRDVLLRFATETRHAFELGDVDTTLLQDLYCRYNPTVQDTASFIKKASALFPIANCGIASLYLRHKLGAGEIISGAYSNNEHTFLLIDTLVVDITADQFGGPSIYVGLLEKPWTIAK